MGGGCRVCSRAGLLNGRVSNVEAKGVKLWKFPKGFAGDDCRGKVIGGRKCWLKEEGALRNCCG